MTPRRPYTVFCDVAYKQPWRILVVQPDWPHAVGQFTGEIVQDGVRLFLFHAATAAECLINATALIRDSAGTAPEWKAAVTTDTERDWHDWNEACETRVTLNNSGQRPFETAVEGDY